MLASKTSAQNQRYPFMVVKPDLQRRLRKDSDNGEEKLHSSSRLCRRDGKTTQAGHFASFQYEVLVKISLKVELFSIENHLS